TALKAKRFCEISKLRAETESRRDWQRGGVGRGETSIWCAQPLYPGHTVPRSTIISRPKRKEFTQLVTWRFILTVSWVECDGRRIGKMRASKVSWQVRT